MKKLQSKILNHKKIKLKQQALNLAHKIIERN
jgi:hypothetical protein